MKILQTLKKIFLLFVITGVILSGTTPVFSATSNDLKTKLTQTNNKKNYMREKKRQADLKLRREQNKLSSNQQKLEKAHEQLKYNTLRYDGLVSNLSSIEKQLQFAVSDFQKQDVEMKDRIRHVYKHQRTGMFESILYARDVSSLLDTLYFQKIIITEDYKKMQELKTKANHIAALKAQVENQKRQIEASIRDINYQRATIKNSIVANKNMIEKLKKDKNYYERTERELARQSASIQNMIAGMTKQNAKSGNTVKSANGPFIWPIKGPVTSPFGYRIHPIFKSRIFHQGIDIGGPNGGAIVASNDGKVIFSGWYGGYGKAVIIDHGIVNGQPITTLYAHMSSITASNGQYVKKGQQIGREGSTGYSTGPHCHFEVRVNGKTVNPLNYI